MNNKEKDFDFEEYKAKTCVQAQVLICGIVILCTFLTAGLLSFIFSWFILISK